MPAADAADLVMMDPAARDMFVVDGHSEPIKAIDRATDEVLGTIATGGGAQGSAIDGRGRLFIDLLKRS